VRSKLTYDFTVMFHNTTVLLSSIHLQLMNCICHENMAYSVPPVCFAGSRKKVKNEINSTTIINNVQQSLSCTHAQLVASHCVPAVIFTERINMRKRESIIRTDTLNKECYKWCIATDALLLLRNCTHMQKT
jgi:hypothetical protein